jgi:hypothetical protein
MPLLSGGYIFTYVDFVQRSVSRNGDASLLRRRSEAGVGLLVGVGDELLVDIVGDVGLPVAGDAGEADSAEKERGEEDGGGQGLKAAALPALGGERGTHIC